MRVHIAIILLFVAALPCFGSNCAPEWNYATDGPRGPVRWGTLDYEWRACAEGKAQSPVNIDNMRLNNNLPLLTFGGGESTFTVRDTGYELRVLVDEPWTLRAAYVPAKLLQFHFHVPAEHLEQGRRNAGEVHFVYQLPNGRLLVVAVWISEGASNDGIARIVAAKPASCESKQSTEKIHIQNFILNWQHYATYDGSLTTPGCGENVTFLILLEGITATADQIAKLKLLSTGNARPVQDLNGRAIQWRQMP